MMPLAVDMRNPKSYILLIFLLMAAGISTYAQSCQPFVDSLNAMVARDQAIRMAPWNEENIQKMDIVDSTNTAHLKALIAQYGFPTWSLVGYAASSQAWLIAQHSNPKFLGEFLKSYRKAVKENNAEKSNLALMEDRHRINEGLPQLYGSQLFGHNAFFPIANIDGVDERRQSMGLEPIKEYAKKFNLDTIIVADFFLDYHSYYYLNLKNAVDAYWEGDYPKTIRSFGTLHYPFPRDLKLLCNAYLAENDTLNAVATARKMVLCGYRIDEDNLLDGFLRDSVAKEYEALVEEYRLQMDDKTNALFDSMQSFNEIKELLDAKHPRYSIDAWNNTIPFIIQKHAEHVGESDYLEFFGWLYGQVIIGNYHLFDYAELYDEVYFRLFGKSYYGQKTSDKEVPLFEKENVNERRKEIQLPPIEVWEGIRNRGCPAHKVY